MSANYMLNTEPSAGLTVWSQSSLPLQHLLVGDTAETHSPIYYVTVTAARNRRKKMVYKVTKYVFFFLFLAVKSSETTCLMGWP